MGIQAAVLRESLDTGGVSGPEERITIEDAIAGFGIKSQVFIWIPLEVEAIVDQIVLQEGIHQLQTLEIGIGIIEKQQGLQVLDVATQFPFAFFGLLALCRK